MASISDEKGQDFLAGAMDVLEKAYANRGVKTKVDGENIAITLNVDKSALNNGTLGAILSAYDMDT